MKTKLYNIFFKYQLLFVILVALDQVTKYIAKANLSSGFSYPILGDWLKLQLTYNTGVAFSMFKNLPPIIFSMVSLICTVAIEYYLIVKKPKDKIFASIMLILAAGAFGNCIDRFLMTFGVLPGVIDFFDMGAPLNAIFNVADIYVTLSCVALILYCLLAKDEDEPSSKELKAIEKELDEHPELVEKYAKQAMEDNKDIEIEKGTTKEENTNKEESNNG